MARAHAANACAQSDSIKGLAQSIEKPSYTRLLTAEPTLRRAVPTLIIAFLITICLGAFVQVLDQSRQKRAAAERDLTALSDYLAERIDRATSGRAERLGNIDRMQFLLPDMLPSWGMVAGRHIIVVGADRRIIARVPVKSSLGETDGILDAISSAQLIAAPSLQGKVIDLILPEKRSIARYLTENDRGDYPRPWAKWQQLFGQSFDTVVMESFPVGVPGLPLWEMVYFKGRPKRT